MAAGLVDGRWFAVPRAADRPGRTNGAQAQVRSLASTEAEHMNNVGIPRQHARPVQAGSRVEATSADGSPVVSWRRLLRHPAPADLVLAIATVTLAVTIAAAPAHAASLPAGDAGAARQSGLSADPPVLMLAIGAVGGMGALATLVRTRRRGRGRVDPDGRDVVVSGPSLPVEAREFFVDARVATDETSTATSTDGSEAAKPGPRWVSQLDSRIPVLPLVQLQQERIVDDADGPGEWDALVQRRGGRRG